MCTRAEGLVPAKFDATVTRIHTAVCVARHARNGGRRPCNTRHRVDRVVLIRAAGARRWRIESPRTCRRRASVLFSANRVSRRTASKQRYFLSEPGRHRLVGFAPRGYPPVLVLASTDDIVAALLPLLGAGHDVGSTSDSTDVVVWRLARLAQGSRRLTELDPLTGLLDRRAFASRLQRALERLTADDTSGLMFIDLDEFKSINDSHEVLESCVPVTRLTLAIRNF
ncbi:MAG: GGDEF domain-containing protein, partial [Marinilabiliales bacterium]|nr:GGDEF domain-containing protein [Marinilabiliales bacterium]